MFDQQIFSYFIIFFIKLSAFLVIIVKNPIHSVLFLVLVFLKISLLLFTLGIDFLPIIFIIIYVGAIAILFLFVIMMIDIKLSNLLNNNNFYKYFSIENFVLLIFFFNLLYFIKKSEFNLNSIVFYIDWIIKFDNLNNLKCIGQFLYTYYFIHFLISGFLLLIGIIGPIVLTLHININSKNQYLYKQLSRHSNRAIFLTTI